MPFLSSFDPLTNLSPETFFPIVVNGDNYVTSLSEISKGLVNAVNSGNLTLIGNRDTLSNSVLSDTLMSRIPNNTGNLLTYSLIARPNGRLKIIVSDLMTANIEVTTNVGLGFSSILFTSPGQTATLLFDVDKWVIISVTGATYS